jgi:hypothetical protein
MKLATIETHIHIKNIIKFLNNSLFILFLLFEVSLQNLILLSDKINIVGINIIFCNNKELKEKIIPFFVPSTVSTLFINVSVVYVITFALAIVGTKNISNIRNINIFFILSLTLY